jgi:hypothetical protein
MRVGTTGGLSAVILFMAGLVATLYAFRRIGKKPGVDPVYDARLARVRPVLLLLGPALIVVSLILAFPAETPEPQNSAWQTVTSSDGVCRVEMPGTPALNADTLILKGLGEPQAEQLKLVQESGAVRYTLSRDLREIPVDLSPDSLFDRVRDNMLLVARRMSDAQLVSERDLSEQGWPGREWVIDMDDQRQQSRWFLVDRRFYRAIVSTPRDETHLRDAGRFLESFHVLRKAGAATPTGGEKGP